MTDRLTPFPLSASASRAVWRQLAIPFFFFLLGVLYASWVARIPSIRDHLQLDAATLSIVLLCCGIGGVGSFPLAAWLNAHYGARRAAWYTGVMMLLSLPGLGYVSSLPALMLLGMLYGATSSCFDVAINTLGIAVEKQSGRSIMSLLHAWFCVGTFSGSLLGSAVAAFEVTPLWHFLALSVLFCAPLHWSCKILPDDRPAPDPDRRIFVIPQGHLAVLGLIVFCCAIVEGSIADWSGLYMKDHMGADDGGAPLAYAAFAGMMLLTRLAGDRLKERWSARRMVVLGALLASVSVFAAVAAVNVPMVILGFAMTGAGVAVAFPFVVSAAGRHGTVALAGVTTLGYSGSLVGPPVIGFLAHGFGLPAALAFVGMLCCAVALAAGSARWLE